MENDTIIGQKYQLWVLLHQVCVAATRARGNELRKFGISRMQATVLFWLKTMNGSVTPAELSRLLFREPHTVFSLLNRMEKQGLVKKVKDLGGASALDKHRVILASRMMDISQEEIAKGIEILKQGGVIAFPTDTVYGLGVDAFNHKAVERVYRIKNRLRHQPFPLLIAGISQLSTVAEPTSGIAWFLARRFWPGGLTLVLPRAASLPTHLSAGHSVAVRIPNHPICLALIQSLRNPMTGTSANISGKPAALTVEEVEQQLAGKIDLVINGGRCPGGKESTVVDVTGETPVILREGIIPKYEIDKAHNEYLEVNSDAHCYRL